MDRRNADDGIAIHEGADVQLRSVSEAQREFPSPRHSRLRELMLGGVTREMLAAMTLLVFVSH